MLLCEYNNLYFYGRLKKCRILYSRFIHFGHYFYKTKYNGEIDGTIWITNDVDWTEETLKDVLIHEMIHHYVVSVDNCRGIDGFGWYGLFGHGWHFRRQIRRIKKEFGLKIHIHHSYIYHRKEKIPTTFFGKLLRFINYEIS